MSRNSRIRKVNRWRGLVRNLEPHLLEEGQLSACRNLVNAEGELVKRPGVVFGDMHFEPQTYWPVSVFMIDLPEAEVNVDMDVEIDIDQPSTSNGGWYSPLPGDDDIIYAPRWMPPFRIIGPDSSLSKKLRFVVTLPFEIKENEAFTLRVVAERFWEDWGGWVKDADFDGIQCDWKAYVFGNGANLLRQKGDLKLADGSTFYLDPRYMAGGTPAWNNGEWQGDVKLLDAKTNAGVAQTDFKFVVEHQYREKGASECDIMWDAYEYESATHSKATPLYSYEYTKASN